MIEDEETRTAVNRVLTRTAQAIANKDVEGFIKLFSQAAQDSNMLNIGLEDEELSLGPARLKERMKKTFDEAESLSLDYGFTTTRANGPVAWISAHVYYTIKKPDQPALKLSARFTGVLEKIKEEWLWVQQHFSVPMDIGKSITEALKKIEAEKAKAAEAAKAAEEAAKAKAEEAKAAVAEPTEAETAEKEPVEGEKAEEKPKKEDIFYEIE